MGIYFPHTNIGGTEPVASGGITWESWKVLSVMTTPHFYPRSSYLVPELVGNYTGYPANSCSL